ncbi:hypothetical protein J2R98_001945 [Alkalibacillus filiformis]|uniref:DUF3324 domain-containing protein n=1 Tax=Alkalibacillus filiformis TaxID=200990 RepID=A0ABU0DUK0_9BACI|nr:hypothetical protein [Alkalibacillus filiformis]MDQ0352111.1 hypothetical protein [Alkalibacillus filiformis]
MRKIILLTVVALLLVGINQKISAEEEEGEVSLGIMVQGAGDYSGNMTFTMSREYENTSTTTQSISESFQPTTGHLLGLTVKVANKPETFDVNVDEGTRQTIDISGDLEPGEEVRVELLIDIPTYVEGGQSGGSSGAGFSGRLGLFAQRDNIYVQVVNVMYQFPQFHNGTEQSHLQLNHFDEERGAENIEPTLPGSNVLTSGQWLVIDEGTNHEHLRDRNNKTDLNEAVRGDLNIAYNVQLNTSPNIWTYVAIGIAFISLIVSVSLVMYVRKLKIQ